MAARHDHGEDATSALEGKLQGAFVSSSLARRVRAAGVEVRIVDPKRIRHFAKAAGRLAKNDPIDAETIAQFAEAFLTAAPNRTMCWPAVKWRAAASMSLTSPRAAAKGYRIPWSFEPVGLPPR